MKVQSPSADRLLTYWRRFIKVLIPSGEHAHRAYVIRLLLLLVMGISLPMSLVHLLADPTNPTALSRIYYSALLTSVAACLYLINRSGRSRLAGWLLTAGATAAIFIWVAANGATNGTHTLYYLVAPIVIISLLLSLRAGAVLLVLYAGLMLFFPWQRFGMSLNQIIGGPLIFNMFLSGVALLVIGYYKRIESQHTSQLAEREALYRTLVENLRDVVYTHTIDGVITSVNGVVETLLGWPREVLIGQLVQDFIHPDDLPATRDMIRQMIQQQPVRVVEIRLRHRSGEYRWVEIKASPILENGWLTMISGVARDVTARNEMETALRASEERYRIISELISDYAYAVRVEPNNDLVIEWLTDSFRLATGYEVSSAQGIMDYSTYHPDDAALARTHIQQVLRGEAVSGEYRGFTRDGKLRWMHVFRRPVWDQQQGRVVRFYAVSQDITQRKEAEAQQLRLALQRERLATVSQLVQAVSHDFRNTLTNIENNRYLIEHLLSDADRQTVQPRLRIIQESVVRMTDQIANLNTVAAVTNPHVAPSDMNRLIDKLVADFTPNAQRKQVNLRFEPCPNLPLIAANADEIQHAVRHLMINALTYTPAGGEITIGTLQLEDTIQIQVRDTGSGLSPEQQTRVFDLFYRADAARALELGGVGLGLSIVKLIVEAHGGQIVVDSAVGQGTSFVITLPIMPLDVPWDAAEQDNRSVSAELGSE